MIFLIYPTNIYTLASMKLRDFTTIADRRKALEAEIGTNLTNIGNYSLDEMQASTRHCENMIGVSQVPMGVAGPLRIKNEELRSKDYYLPLATTEGALVASVSRGCKAVTESGGVFVYSERKGITRAPVFAVKNIAHGKEIIKGIQEHIDVFKKIAESTSKHLTLVDIKPWLVGRNLYLRFQFNTQDAMGMNMATIATAAIAQHIEEKTEARLIALSGNMCVDKKPNFLNFIEGRGIPVWAEAIIPHAVIQEILKTDAKALCEVYQRKVVTGSMLSGTIGANAHSANILAAIFLATGQDIAHIAECSMNVTTVEEDEKGVYISVYLPDLVVGIVGGGTGLATQSEALSILRVKNSQELAEVIGASVLAGELSLLASLAENSLACAHQSLARGKTNIKSQMTNNNIQK